MRLWPSRTLNTAIVQPAKDATREDQPHASILTNAQLAGLQHRDPAASEMDADVK